MPKHPIDRSPGLPISPVSTEAVEEHLERLQADLARLKCQIRHTQRLAAIGTAAAGLAHEINNLMTPVLGYAKSALDQNDTVLMTKALQVTLRQIDAARAMTDRILALAIDEPAAFKSIPVARVIDDAVCCLCRDLSKDGITLSIDVRDDLTVRANSKLLQQVFFNLLLNAREALAGRTGRVTIRAEAVKPNRDPECDQGGSPKGADEDTVQITVSDTGHGIALENLPSIFDDFFTTKQASGENRQSGSGLGLSICRDIIEEHRGDITVQSRAGAGTTFTVTLPAAG